MNLLKSKRSKICKQFTTTYLIFLIIMEKSSNLKPKLFLMIWLKINNQTILKTMNKIILIMKINNSVILLMMNKIILSIKMIVLIKIDKKYNLNNLKKNKNQ